MRRAILGLMIVAGCSAAVRATAKGNDLSVWPNAVSFRNSDPWLWQNHDKIRKMRPKVLVLNFANDCDMPKIRKHCEDLVAALAESTRYHGFEDPKSPAFLEYQVVKYIDMRDANPPPDRANRSSSLFPRMPDGPKDFNCDYSIFYGEDFARRYGFEDPKQKGRYLNLHELINAGLVHELWFYAIHTDEGWPAYEVIELKQYYDDDCRPIKGKHGWAGNGHSDTMPWSGRTFRMAFFNPHRGIGCAMENFAHGLEGMANSGSIAYYRRYFNEYAELDLDGRYKLPFKSLYALDYRGRDKVEYPTAASMKITRRGREHIIDPYVAFGGNTHFPPGGRRHYDLSSPTKTGASATARTEKTGNCPSIRTSSGGTTKWPPTAWARGWSSGGSACPAWTTGRWMTAADR